MTNQELEASIHRAINDRAPMQRVRPINLILCLLAGCALPVAFIYFGRLEVGLAVALVAGIIAGFTKFPPRTFAWLSPVVGLLVGFYLIYGAYIPQVRVPAPPQGKDDSRPVPVATQPVWVRPTSPSLGKEDSEVVPVIPAPTVEPPPLPQGKVDVEPVPVATVVPENEGAKALEAPITGKVDIEPVQSAGKPVDVLSAPEPNTGGKSEERTGGKESKP